MPYVAVRTSEPITQEQVLSLQSALSAAITLIPGKTEAGLMIDISGSQQMFHGGESKDVAFVEIRCYGQTAFEAKKAYALAVFEALERVLGIPARHVYYNHIDLDTWGSGGGFRAY